jgi:hypothetical protein
MNERVTVLAVSGGDLYAGGQFTMAGGTAANRIAKWNGSSWTALGSGITNGGVNALVVSGGELYAGGWFTKAGGGAANFITKWDGNSWVALGSGVSAAVTALAVSGRDIYAGGFFNTAGNVWALGIAKWDGNNWTSLGTIGSVLTLAVSGCDLYAGGDFTTAGGKVSGYVARAYLQQLPALLVRRSGPGVTVTWPSTDATGFGLEQTGTLALPANWVSHVDNVTDDGTNKSVTIPATNSPQYFRLHRP